MPATSKAQQGFMGMVHAYKKGALKAEDIPTGVRKRVLEAAKSISDEDASHFASTPTKGLPRHAKGTTTNVRRVRSA